MDFTNIQILLYKQSYDFQHNHLFLMSEHNGYAVCCMKDVVVYFIYLFIYLSTLKAPRGIT